MKKISIIVPVYNEVTYIKDVIEKIDSFQPIHNIEKEIIVIDDFSTDGTREYLKEITNTEIIKIFNSKNTGKGYSLRQGIKIMKGDYFIVHDADFEYETNEINNLINIVYEKKADVVYGSRFLSGEYKRVLFFWHTIGNKFLTLLSNLFSNLNLSDMETCFKLISKKTISKIDLRENRFGFEPEVTAKIGNLNKKENIRIFEVGVSYNGRTYQEGKKINWKDGFAALKCILLYGLFFK